MKIQNQQPPVPQRPPGQSTPPPGDPQPVDHKEPGPPPESGGHKAMRVLAKTAMAAGYGAIAGYVGQQPGSGPALGAMSGAVLGLGYGASAGWQAGKAMGLHLAGKKEGEPIVKGIGALMLTFGGPFVGGATGLVAGAAAAGMGGPVVTAALFGGMALTAELCRD